MWDPHWARKFIKVQGNKENCQIRRINLTENFLITSTFFMSHFLGGDFYRKYFVKNSKIISPFFHVNFLNFLAHIGSDNNFLVGIIIGTFLHIVTYLQKVQGKLGIASLPYIY